MLPRKVFHTRPGLASNLRSEVVNTESSDSDSARISWRLEELCAERILDTARASPAQSQELIIPEPVKVSRQVCCCSCYETSS